MSIEKEQWYVCCDAAKSEASGRWALFFICVVLVIYGIVGK